MNRTMLKMIVDKAKSADKVVIVGASVTGREIGELLYYEKIDVYAFFDNDKNLYTESINHVKVMAPYKLDANALYIIASINYRDELYEQLLQLGIKKEEIVKYYQYKSDDYYKDLDPVYYQDDLDERFYQLYGRYINWESPQTFNEIINWEKIYDRDERKTQLADKYLVRDWVKEKIGEKYLNKLYGVWDTAEEIDFDSLPEQFVLKLNHGCGYNIIVKDKACIDKEEICNQLTKWRKTNFFYRGLQWQYKNIVPKIICEEYLENLDENLYDYKVFCFDGEPKYVGFLIDRFTSVKMASYDTEWNRMPFAYYEIYDKDVPKPDNLDEMLELSRILSQGFRHVRVDWYSLPNNKLIFGEMTFSCCNGWGEWRPPEYDMILGKMVKL